MRVITRPHPPTHGCKVPQVPFISPYRNAGLRFTLSHCHRGWGMATLNGREIFILYGNQVAIFFCFFGGHDTRGPRATTLSPRAWALVLVEVFVPDHHTQPLSCETTALWGSCTSRSCRTQRDAHSHTPFLCGRSPLSISQSQSHEDAYLEICSHVYTQLQWLRVIAHRVHQDKDRVLLLCGKDRSTNIVPL